MRIATVLITPSRRPETDPDCQISNTQRGEAAGDQRVQSNSNTQTHTQYIRLFGPVIIGCSQQQETTHNENEPKMVSFQCEGKCRQAKKSQFAHHPTLPLLLLSPDGRTLFTIDCGTCVTGMSRLSISRDLQARPPTPSPGLHPPLLPRCPMPTWACPFALPFPFSKSSSVHYFACRSMLLHLPMPASLDVTVFCWLHSRA